MSNNEQALQKRPSNGLQSGIEIRTMQDVQEVGKMIAHSGMFSDIRDASQAGVKILAGQELGIPPMAAIRGVHVFDGQTTISGPLLAALIKRHPKYDYREEVSNDKEAAINFYEHGDHVGVGRFGIQEARDAGLLGKRNWQNYREDMLFWRALSRGKKRYAPEVGNGPIYVPDEIGVETDAQNNPVQVDHEAKQIPESSPEMAAWRGEEMEAKRAALLQNLDDRMKEAAQTGGYGKTRAKAVEYTADWPDSMNTHFDAILGEADAVFLDGLDFQECQDVWARLWRVLDHGGMNALADILRLIESEHDTESDDIRAPLSPFYAAYNIYSESTIEGCAGIAEQAVQYMHERGVLVDRGANLLRRAVEVASNDEAGVVLEALEAAISATQATQESDETVSEADES